MTTTTFLDRLHIDAGSTGFLKTLEKLFSGISASREAEARLLVTAHLLTLDEATLSRLGYDRAQLEAAPSSPVARF